MYIFKIMSLLKKFETDWFGTICILVQYNLFYWRQKPDTYIGVGFNVMCT